MQSQYVWVGVEREVCCPGRQKRVGARRRWVSNEHHPCSCSCIQMPASQLGSSLLRASATGNAPAPLVAVLRLKSLQLGFQGQSKFPQVGALLGDLGSEGCLPAAWLFAGGAFRGRAFRSSIPATAKPQRRTPPGRLKFNVGLEVQQVR